MTTVAPPAAVEIAPALRRLYLARFGFAVAWALLVFAGKADLNPFVVALLVLYPAFDAAAAVVDARSTGATTRGLQVNVAISVLAAVGIAVACASGLPAVLRVWGAWAVVAGLVQLLVGVARRRSGGQWPMILSGGISVLAGASFVVMASSAQPSLTSVVGYAVLGGVFFLVSALRLGRR